MVLRQRTRFAVAAFISEAGDAGRRIHGVPVIAPTDWTDLLPRMIYPGKKVSDWAKIGLASVVLRNVPTHATVFGNPATRIDRPA